MAERWNQGIRARERLEFVDTGDGLLYTWTGVPPSPTFGVVICSSLSAEFLANYQRERELALHLARSGAAVSRFHYFGEGNSEGDTSEITFDTMVRDARTVRAHLAATTGVDQLAIVGTRLGALVATSLTSRDDVLALWEPIEDPIAYLSDGVRARAMTDIAAGTQADGAAWRSQLAEHGVLDLLGYQVHRNLVDSLDGRSIQGCAREPSRRTLVVDFGSRRSRATRAADALAHAGHAVDRVEIEVGESCWFHDERRADGRDLVRATTSWIRSNLVAGTSAPSPAPGS